MTVAENSGRSKQACNGILTTFPFTMGIADSGDIAVILSDANGTETTLVEGVNYYVSCTNSNCSFGGSVIITETDGVTPKAYAAGYYIIIVFDVPISQESDFTEGMATLYETFEAELDKQARILQQLREQIRRSFSVSVTTGSTNPYTVPAPIANNLIGWNSAGTNLANFTTQTVTVPQIDYIGNYNDDLDAAVTAIGSNPTTLMIPYVISLGGKSPITPTTLDLWFTNGGRVNGTGVETLTVNGGIIAAPAHQWVGDDVTVVAGVSCRMGEVSGNWWGETGAAFNAAIDFFAAVGGGTVWALPGAYEPEVTIEVDPGVRFKSFTSGTHATARTVFKPTAAVAIGILAYKAGTDFGFDIDGIQVDMDNMAAGSIGIDIASQWRWTLKNTTIYNLNNNATIGLQIRGVAGQSGNYHALLENVLIRDGVQKGIGLNMVGILAGTKRVNQIVFNKLSAVNLYDGVVMDECGGGIIFNAANLETNAHNGATITNQSIGAAPLFIGGEIGTNTNIGVDGIATLINVAMSSNGTNLANGAWRQQQNNTAGLGIVSTTGMFRPEQLGMGLGGTQTLGAADSIDVATDGGIIPVVSSGGAVTMVSDPQIDAAVVGGQFVILLGISNTDYPIFVDGQGLRLSENWEGKLDNILLLFYYDGYWIEMARSHRSFVVDVTAAGAGTDGTISSRSANPLGECDGFELRNGKYFPYWNDITP